MAKIIVVLVTAILFTCMSIADAVAGDMLNNLSLSLTF